MSNRPVELLDSGLGGLAVLKKIMRKLPNEATVSIGDQAHMPCGDKTAKGVIELTRKNTDFSLSKNVEVTIFACSTAAAAAMEMIQKKIVLRITGVIQSGSLAVAKITKDNRVAIIDTHVTTELHAYSRETKLRNPDTKITKLATPRLASPVEAQCDFAYNVNMARGSLGSLKEKDFDTVVLDCTHYPITKKETSEIASSTTKLVDPADRVAQYTESILRQDGMLAGEKGRYEYCMTGGCEKFTGTARKWLDDPQLVASHVETGERQ